MKNAPQLLQACPTNLHVYICCTYKHQLTHFAHRTQFECLFRENRNFCRWTVHSLTDLSSEAVMSSCPSDEKATLLTAAV